MKQPGGANLSITVGVQLQCLGRLGQVDPALSLLLLQQRQHKGFQCAPVSLPPQLNCLRQLARLQLRAAPARLPLAAPIAALCRLWYPARAPILSPSRLWLLQRHNQLQTAVPAVRYLLQGHPLFSTATAAAARTRSS